jgi:hypothetical protein
MQEITADQLVEWQEYYNIEPFGYRVEHRRAGVLAATIANTSGVVKRAYTPDELLPIGENKKPMSEAEKVLQTFVGAKEVGKWLPR